jgi:hypothetical protein
LKLEVSIEEMRKKKIFIGTPMYGGQCHGMYTKACCDLAAMCANMGIELRFFFLFNESLITRARNYIADEFLRSGFTHLLFIDSDIGFNPQDALALIALADEESDKDIVCGTYPKKCIAWERIVSAVQNGIPPNNNPADLEQYVGDFVFNPVGGQQKMMIGEPVEVLESGTGFMCIQRKVLEKYAEEYKDYSYLPDHNRSEHFDGSREITAFFDTIIDPESKRYLSEDYMFCQWSRKIGFKVWACPWMQLQHIGSHVFSGNLPAIAQLPNASHGGLVDSPVAKIGGSGGKVDMSGFKPNDESIANRAERRRTEAAERRKKRKEAKKTAKAK